MGARGRKKQLKINLGSRGFGGGRRGGQVMGVAEVWVPGDVGEKLYMSLYSRWALCGAR